MSGRIEGVGHQSVPAWDAQVRRCPSTLGRCWDAPGTSQERPRPGTVGASQLGHPEAVPGVSQVWDSGTVPAGCAVLHNTKDTPRTPRHHPGQRLNPNRCALHNRPVVQLLCSLSSHSLWWTFGGQVVDFGGLSVNWFTTKVHRSPPLLIWKKTASPPLVHP